MLHTKLQKEGHACPHIQAITVIPSEIPYRGHEFDEPVPLRFLELALRRSKVLVTIASASAIFRFRGMPDDPPSTSETLAMTRALTSPEQKQTTTGNKTKKTKQ